MTHVMIWRFSLDRGEFAASCPSDISAVEASELLEFIDLMRRPIERLANSTQMAGQGTRDGQTTETGHVDEKVAAGEETHG